ncbi:small ribosomal subunit protein uS9m isoform X2 [Siphateles boraxobius]|uniref:small ribosomal subunit protein uS9m isoform X2 n=1 Tax=Siphateles boraxobius TaxID=180520 RepID=UPI004063CDA5
MAASSCRGVRSILWKYVSCGKSLCVSRSKTAPQLPVRQICVSSSLWKKNLAAAGPQKFTQEFINKQVEEFEVGKRHLANMMGEDPETFTQEDIDRSIAYLFPSGLFDKRARPIMKHPEQIFPKQTAVQWDAEGRPFHFLFYTGKQSYYSLLHDLYEKILAIERHQDKMRDKGLFTSDTKQIMLTGSRWLLKEEMEEHLVENVSDQDYVRLIQLMEKLLSMPYCSLEEEFVLKFRRKLEVQSSKQEIPVLQYDPQGVAFSVADEGSQPKPVSPSETAALGTSQSTARTTSATFPYYKTGSSCCFLCTLWACWAGLTSRAVWRAVVTLLRLELYDWPSHGRCSALCLRDKWKR